MRALVYSSDVLPRVAEPSTPTITNVTGISPTQFDVEWTTVPESDQVSAEPSRAWDPDLKGQQQD